MQTEAVASQRRSQGQKSQLHLSCVTCSSYIHVAQTTHWSFPTTLGFLSIKREEVTCFLPADQCSTCHSARMLVMMRMRKERSRNRNKVKCSD